MLSSLSVFVQAACAASFESATKSSNAFGLDLYRKIPAREGNLCLSPYSISCALAMTLAGADGATRTEMARVLHVDLGGDVDLSFAALQQSLEEMAAKTAKIEKDRGGPSEPITIAIANRLFSQIGYEFRPQFFSHIKESYGATPELLDFKTNAAAAAAATRRINDWVAKQTRDRIRDLIPSPLEETTRLVLANAIYFKAPWADEFSANATKPEPFHVRGKEIVDVPTMQKREHLRYAKREGFTAVAIPYSGGDLQFVILCPDKIDGVRAMEDKLSATVLADCAKMNDADVFLHLPKFKFEPPTIQLSKQLQALGMKTAFDIPPGSANFDRMAPRKPNSYLAISEVFHQTFIAVDEKGTEAAAATAVVMMELTAAMRPQKKPIEVKVDRPFVYAIQHVPSGACLFIGRVADPR